MGNKPGKDGKAPGGKKAGKPAKLSKKDLDFLTSKTSLNKEAIEMFFKQFNDNNPDGLLNRDEFSKLYPKLRNEPVNNLDEISNMVFRAFDTDNNGSLTFEEFLIGYAITSRGDQRSKLQYAFELYDADNNGWLSQAELKEVLLGMYDTKPFFFLIDFYPLLISIFRLDLLGSNKSSIDGLVTEISKQLDTSGDGKISKGK
jgi:Ca2+-binding EF-hand superfamily protein